jgi:hypothetical protein
MKKLRRILLNTVIYFAYFFLSCILVMLVEALFLKLLDRFILLSYLAQTVIRLVIYSVGVPALVGVAGYAEGYREADAHPGETAVSGMLAAVIPHGLIALLFHFRQFCAGAVPFLVGLLRDGTDVTADSIVFNDIGKIWLFLAVFLGYGILNTAVLTISRRYGVRRRQAQRADMGFTPDGRGRTDGQ